MTKLHDANRCTGAERIGISSHTLSLAHTHYPLLPQHTDSVFMFSRIDWMMQSLAYLAERVSKIRI